jgi:hypothetical protein
MSAPFRVGDKVRILENGYRIRPGEIHVVSNVVFVHNLRCWCINLEGQGTDRFSGFRAHRFELYEGAQEVEPERRWIVIEDTGGDGNMISRAYFVLTGTLEDARRMCEDLLKAQSGLKLSFGVLTDTACVDKAPVKFTKL